MLYINYPLPRVPSDVRLFWCIQNRSPPVDAKELKGSRTNFIVPTYGATVQIRSQVHISERLSALGLTRRSFVLGRKGVPVGLKDADVVYSGGARICSKPGQKFNRNFS
ncbi:hypothetical protein QL285_042703 [Trifolium repens]|nr:hypothetical protein QL285_042703 [Trifolium repens]